MTTFQTATWFSPSAVIIHEQQVANRYLPLYQQVAVLRHLLSETDRTYIEAQGQKFATTGTVSNAAHLAEWCREKLREIAMKQAKSGIRDVSVLR